MTKRGNNFQDPRWAKWQIFCGGAPVGKPVLAVSEKQAIHIKRNRQTGPVCYNEWTAKRISLTLEEAESLAEFDAVSPGAKLCPVCGCPDPSPAADACPSCEAPYPENPD